MLLSQLRLEERRGGERRGGRRGRGGAARHSGGTVTIHYNLMLDAILEFLCGNQICKKKKKGREERKRACHSRTSGTEMGRSGRRCEAELCRRPQKTLRFHHVLTELVLVHSSLRAWMDAGRRRTVYNLSQLQISFPSVGASEPLVPQGARRSPANLLTLDAVVLFHGGDCSFLWLALYLCPPAGRHLVDSHP